jgi:hypothetical protein
LTILKSLPSTPYWLSHHSDLPDFTPFFRRSQAIYARTTSISFWAPSKYRPLQRRNKRAEETDLSPIPTPPPHTNKKALFSFRHSAMRRNIINNFGPCALLYTVVLRNGWPAVAVLLTANTSVKLVCHESNPSMQYRPTNYYDLNKSNFGENFSDLCSGHQVVARERIYYTIALVRAHPRHLHPAF